MSNIKNFRILEKLFISALIFKPRELDKWFLSNRISFTHYGDSIPAAVYSLGNNHEIKMFVNGVTSKQLIYLILETMTGMIIFKDIIQERIFWDNSQKRIRDEFSISIPKFILPKDLFKLSQRNNLILKEYQ